MSLLREIEASIVDPNSDLSSILLKLRLLASRLGSRPLEEWVKHEAEGYPEDIEVPEYRKIPVSHSGNWAGPFGSGIQNAPIPPALIAEHAGERWLTKEMRESAAAVDGLLSYNKDQNETLRVDASNLTLLLQGHVYPEWNCIAAWGRVSKTSLREIQNAVRNRILEMIIELEKEVPAAAEVSLGPPQPDAASASDAVTQIYHQTIYGPFTNVTSTGANANLNLTIAQGDTEAMIGELVKAGIPQDAATEFAEIVAGEEPGSAEAPFGERTRAWLARNIGKAADGTWKIGMTVATKVLEEAAMQYSGLR